MPWAGGFWGSRAVASVPQTSFSCDNQEEWSLGAADCFPPPSRQGDCTIISGEYEKTSTPGKYTYYNPSKLGSLATCSAPRAAAWLGGGNQRRGQLAAGEGVRESWARKPRHSLGHFQPKRGVKLGERGCSSPVPAWARDYGMFQ